MTLFKIKTVIISMLIGVCLSVEPIYDNHHHHHEHNFDLSQYGFDEATLLKLFKEQEHYSAPVAAPIVAPIAKIAIPTYQKVHVEPTTAPHYEYGYSVQDPHTGDIKSQHETRKGDTVHGSYSVVDADGTKRTVEYTADAHHGFNAVVRKEPAHVKVKTAIVKQPIQYTAPIAKLHAVPYQPHQHYGLDQYSANLHNHHQHYSQIEQPYYH